MILWWKVLNWNLKDLKQREKQLDAEGEAIGQARGETIGTGKRRGNRADSGRSSTGKPDYSTDSGSENGRNPIVSTDSKRREQLYKEYGL